MKQHADNTGISAQLCYGSSQSGSALLKQIPQQAQASIGGAATRQPERGIGDSIFGRNQVSPAKHKVRQ
jgi:hypothetical protein